VYYTMPMFGTRPKAPQDASWSVQIALAAMQHQQLVHCACQLRAVHKPADALAPCMHLVFFCVC